MIVDYMKSEYNIFAQLKDINDYLDTQATTFDKELDSVCIIIDRNVNNLKDRYSEFYTTCNEKGYRLFVSNPDFELWLLLHSNSIFSYDRKELLDNAKGKNGKRFLENVLRKHL